MSSDNRNGSVFLLNRLITGAQFILKNSFEKIFSILSKSYFLALFFSVITILKDSPENKSIPESNFISMKLNLSGNEK